MMLQFLASVFPQQYLRAALIVSLLSVWVLVALFYYLNRYTKRDYFSIWTAGWLFYALWLTLGLEEPRVEMSSILFLLRQSCLAISAVFFLWGSVRFVHLEARQTLFGLFMLYLLVWIFVTPQVFSNPLQVQLPVFIVIGLSSMFAGACFHRLRQKLPYVGAGMLSVGFLLWGLYLASYPLCQDHRELFSAGFFLAAVLQLYIAVGMIVLVLEEVRHKSEQMHAEITAVRSEKEALQAKMLTTEEQCRNLFDQMRLSEGVQEAYDELRQTQQVVVQQERLRALGQMASGVAHDINNVLCPVLAYSELMLKTPSDRPESERRQLEVIHRSGEEIAHIVKRLREFYRRRAESEELVQVNMNEIIEQVIGLTRPRWRDQAQRDGITIEIERVLQPKLRLLACDLSDVREALINLIFNAVDALPSGGRITLSTHAEANIPAAAANQAPRDELIVEVRDNGIGMDERTRQHCLEPFFSTKTQRGGSGLGLAMVYGMIQRHGGRIDIESTLGMGTCIRLVFPLCEALTRADAAKFVPLPTQRRSLRILCIDDEPEVRVLIKDCLGNLGHEVTTASSGQQGVELFQEALQTDRAYHTVITDLGMPGLDGHQVARSIKAASPETPVVMLTGWVTATKEQSKEVPEVNAVVGKPASVGELNNLLLRLTSARPAPAISSQS